MIQTHTLTYRNWSAIMHDLELTQKEREEGEFQYSGSDDEAPPEADERAGEPSSILQVSQ